MQLKGIIPGPGDFDPYMDVIEILSLNGVRVYDGYHNDHFQLKALNAILQVFDYPGQIKVLKCVGIM